MPATDDFHAVLSPSSSSRWLVCPGSVMANAAVTEADEGNQASREGTIAHALLELCVLFGFKPQEFLGDHIMGEDMPPVAQHMIDGVEHMLDWIEEYVDFYGEKNVLVLPEHRVYIGSMIGVSDEVCNGTADLQIVHKNKSCLVTVDYKHGMMPVDAENNSQMMLYTAGGIKEHGRFKEYKNIIVQPRAAKRRAIEEVTFGQSKLTKFLGQAGRAAQAALMPNAPRVAGDHCRFCRAASNCQTYRQRARQVAADEFAPIAELDPNEIPNEQLNEVLREAVILEQWIKSIKARALAYLQSGGTLDDYVVGFGTRKRVFQDEAAVIEWCQRHKLPVDVFMPRELLSPKGLENVLKKHGLFPRAKRGEQKPDSPIAHLIGYTVPKAAIKPRKEVDDFDAVEDDE